MKQQIVLIGFVFAMLTAAYSQSDNSATATTTPVDTAKVKDYCPHRIWVNTGMAYSNDIYKRFDNIQQKYAFANMLEVGYSYFFHPKMGVGLGVGVSKISAKALLGNGGSITVKEEGYDPMNPEATYDLFFKGRNFAEKQNIWAIEVPLTFQFEHKMGDVKRNGIFAALGVKGYFPISARTNFTDGDIELSGKEAGIAVDWPSTLNPHFGVVGVNGNYAKSKLRPSVDIIGEFGGLFGVTKTTDFYIGVYASYGFLDILPKDENKVTYIQKEGGNDAIVNGFLNSDALKNQKLVDKDFNEKWNLFQVGLKVGFRFKTCGQSSQSMREAKRDFLDNYEERAGKAGKKGRGDDDGDDKKGKKNGEAVYIIPIYIGNVGGDEDGSGNGKGSKSITDGLDDANVDKDIRELADAFTKAQIYFDLDKDIPKNPKLANKEVDRAISVLQRRPDLKVILGGYTCKLGTHDHNADLAQRRANRIRQMLLDKGISPKQIETQAFTAEDYPMGTFSTLEDARTVIVKIIKQ